MKTFHRAEPFYMRRLRFSPTCGPATGRDLTIHLVGPGGAGKSTVGVLLSDRLNRPFVDLDRCFRDRSGDISDFLQRYGYQAYGRENVDVYGSIAAEGGVMALSSGFMTYPEEVHPSYAKIRAAIGKSSTTFVLLPSLDIETCVAEIVRRQVCRPFGLVASHEEAKIRERFLIYMALPALKVTTLQSPDAVVTEIINVLRATRRSIRTLEHEACWRRRLGLRERADG